MRRGVLIGVLILIAGGALASFGTVYYTINDFVTPHQCSSGCSGTAIQPVVIGYFLYPLWSPPTYSTSQTGALTTCEPQVEQQGWYTPLDPPPACLPPPVAISENRTLSIAGLVALGFGALVVVRSQSRRDETVDGAPESAGS